MLVQVVFTPLLTWNPSAAIRKIKWNSGRRPAYHSRTVKSEQGHSGMHKYSPDEKIRLLCGTRVDACGFPYLRRSTILWYKLNIILLVWTRELTIGLDLRPIHVILAVRYPGDYLNYKRQLKNQPISFPWCITLIDLLYVKLDTCSIAVGQNTIHHYDHLSPTSLDAALWRLPFP